MVADPKGGLFGIGNPMTVTCGFVVVWVNVFHPVSSVMVDSSHSLLFGFCSHRSWEVPARNWVVPGFMVSLVSVP